MYWVANVFVVNGTKREENERNKRHQTFFVRFVCYTQNNKTSGHDRRKKLSHFFFSNKQRRKRERKKRITMIAAITNALRRPCMAKNNNKIARLHRDIWKMYTCIFGCSVFILPSALLSFLILVLFFFLSSSSSLHAKFHCHLIHIMPDVAERYALRFVVIFGSTAINVESWMKAFVALTNPMLIYLLSYIFSFLFSFTPSLKHGYRTAAAAAATGKNNSSSLTVSNGHCSMCLCVAAHWIYLYVFLNA